MVPTANDVEPAASGVERTAAGRRPAQIRADRPIVWRSASVTLARSLSVEKETGDSVVLALSLDDGRRVSGRCDRTSSEARSRVGAVTILPPGCRYAQTIEGPASALLFDISWRDMSAWLSEEGDTPMQGLELRPVQCGSDDTLAKSLFALTAGRSTTPGDAIQAVAMRLVERHSNRTFEGARQRAFGGLTPKQMRRVAENVEDVAGRLTVDGMMDGLGISRFHFIRAFKATCGLTPYQHLLRYRTDLALEMLLDGRAEPQAVAENVGFSHASHMSRMVKRRFGVTPGEFRRAVHPSEARWRGRI